MTLLPLSRLAACISLGFASVAALPTWAAPTSSANTTQKTEAPSALLHRASTSQQAIRLAARDASNVFDVIMGEMYLQRDELSLSYGHLMRAAQKTQDTRLYARAAHVAIQARQPSAALQAVQEWQAMAPQDAESYNYQLQLLLLLDRDSEVLEPLQKMLALQEDGDKLQRSIHVLPSLYKELNADRVAVEHLQTALQPYTERADTAFVSRLALARAYIGDSQWQPALSVLQSAQQAQPPQLQLGASSVTNADLPALVALDILRNAPRGSGLRGPAERFIRQSIQDRPDASPVLPSNFAATLVALNRSSEAEKYLNDIVLPRYPDHAPALHLLGNVYAQQGNFKNAEITLLKYLKVRAKNKEAVPDNDDTVSRRSAIIMQRMGEDQDTQAFMMLANLAFAANNVDTGNAWLRRIPNAEVRLNRQLESAQIFKRQGQLDEALQVAATLPSKTAEERATRALVTAQLLEDVNDRQVEAIDALTKALEESPNATELLYHRGLAYERSDQMPAAEADWRRAITLQPDSSAAYNALGYSLANRNLRLPEARDLIRKALAMSPESAAIQDSMGWVEYRMGNLKEARKWLEKAWLQQPEAEVAAHLGEVLWKLGEREQANTIFELGKKHNAQDKVLQETLQRLGVQP